ncbi:MAG TPA: DUF1800 domain-containing protein [Bryobacteraceae bacterium]|nr:DUF1800 domain-containing protein [Bryobacteraceae bacterium]
MAQQRRFLTAMAAAGMGAAAVCFQAGAQEALNKPRFDKKLSSEQQILQALNRLTFGARFGDIEEVRRMGVMKWIELQLHPERIAENPALEAKLKPLETLRMTPEEIIAQTPNPLGMAIQTRPTPAAQLVGPEQMQKILNGTAEERRAALMALDAEKRRIVLRQISPGLVESFPDLKKEMEEARRAEQQEQQQQMRRMNPQLSDLLNPDQAAMAQRGNREQLEELFRFLEPDKREQVAAALPPQALAEFPEMRRLWMKRRQPQQIATADLREGKVYRALYSNRQLEEVLVDFWFNHFNVYEGKNIGKGGLSGPVAYHALLTSFERDAIRPHVLGTFQDLLLAVARHPAMLYYLDNWESMSADGLDQMQVGPFAPAPPPPGFPIQPNLQAHGLNENYGRELMELHTMGVDGGYTQQDVIAVARCFTGWTIKHPFTKPEFTFAAFMHDGGEKTVLGHKIAAGGGEQDGLQAIDILAHHASTAKFISKELAQRFVADNPPRPLVNRMAQTFLKTGGDLRAVMETMFTSPEFFSEGAWLAKVKSPLEMAASAMRATGSEAMDAMTLAQKIGDLGEPLYGKIDPKGYSNNGEGWLNTAGLLGRMNFAMALVSGQIAGVRLDGSRWEGKDAATIAREVLGRDPWPETQAAMAKGLEGKRRTARMALGLILSSPDFQRR